MCVCVQILMTQRPLKKKGIFDFLKHFQIPLPGNVWIYSEWFHYSILSGCREKNGVIQQIRAFQCRHVGYSDCSAHAQCLASFSKWSAQTVLILYSEFAQETCRVVLEFFFPPQQKKNVSMEEIYVNVNWFWFLV